MKQSRNIEQMNSQQCTTCLLTNIREMLVGLGTVQYSSPVVETVLFCLSTYPSSLTESTVNCICNILYDTWQQLGISRMEALTCWTLASEEYFPCYGGLGPQNFECKALWESFLHFKEDSCHVMTELFVSQKLWVWAVRALLNAVKPLWPQLRGFKLSFNWLSEKQSGCIGSGV